MKTRFGLAWLGVLALGMGGCAGAAASGAATATPAATAGQDWGGGQEFSPEPPSATGPVAPLPAPGAPSRAEFPGAAQPAPASAAPSRPPSSEEAERAPSQRPGLGTQWGETRYSQVHDEPFIRADRDDPFALVAVRYDDRPGVDAMIARAPEGSFSRSRSVALARGWIALSVRDEHGHALDAWHAGDRTYVVGRAGERYSIVLSNHTGRRFEAVATVDGLDVISGRSGSLSNRGYLLDPNATLEIDGFRQSDDTVAAFRFGRVADSYAAKTGSAREVGVIGVAFFAEFGDTSRDDEARLRESATPFPNDPRYAQPPP